MSFQAGCLRNCLLGDVSAPLQPLVSPLSCHVLVLSRRRVRKRSAGMTGAMALYLNANMTTLTELQKQMQRLYLNSTWTCRDICSPRRHGVAMAPPSELDGMLSLM